MSDAHDGMYIDEPLDQYQKVYKDLHKENATKYIDALIEKSQVDVNQNRETVKKIRKQEAERDLLVKHIKKQNGLKGFLIFLTVLLFAGAIFSGFQLYQLGYNVLYVALIPVLLVVAILFIFLIRKKINPKIKELKGLKAVVDDKIKVLYQEAYAQMKPLNDLFEYGIAKKLFQETIPLIKMDKMFDSRRYDYMVNKFGLADIYDKDRSTLFVQSGEINGNPFFICEDLVHVLGTETYSGSITIHWTTTSTVNGKRVTNHHSQVLTATVTKPCPRYYEQPYLVYANDAAPDLIFSRQDSDAEHMSEKQIEKQVNKDIKKLSKKAEKSVTQGSNYTVLANSEFEVLFGATNRNHEVQFRLLFTPLAQRELLEIMKDKEIGYGDDFDFVKHKKINRVYPEHLHKFEFDVMPPYYWGYDIDAIKEKFLTYTTDYFKRIYFTFAPVLAIPLYQHTLPQEYIYKDLYESYVSFYEHERVVNHMNEHEFKHPLSTTRNILKTKVVESKAQADVVKVVAYGYRTEQRTDYINKMGGDGRMHTIPVHWTEYIPVEQASKVEVNVVETEQTETHQDRFRKLFEDLKNKEVNEKDVFMLSSFVAHVLKDK